MSSTLQPQAERRSLGRFDGSGGPRVIGPLDGTFADLRSLGVRFMAWDMDTGGGFSVVEHPIPPRTLVAPLHRHQREDEYSFIIEGTMGAQLGNDVVFANAGDFVFKPRQQWHTFWNAGDFPCRVLEIISPGGFEHFFSEVNDLMQATGAPNPGVALAGSDLPDRYAIEFKPGSIEELCRRHGLVYPSG